MEWSKDKTMKLIELLQVNADLWNPALCYTRRDKQKRREELRTIADALEVYVPDVTKKIQHLRTQYNRESAQETRAKFESPSERYVSTWYAYDHLHFLKYSNKPYGILQSNDTSNVHELNSHSDCLNDCKSSPPNKISRRDSSNSIKNESHLMTSTIKDDLCLFGEYIANELRSVKGEKNLLIAKKKILDVIFEVKMNSTCEVSTEPTVCTVFAHTRNSTNSIHSDKEFTSPTTISTAQIEPLPATHAPPTTCISEIIINGTCHYS